MMIASKNPRVFIVDDEPDVCWVLKILLQKHDYQVDIEESGKRALARLKKSGHLYQLVLLDAKLSDIEGVDLARLIRSETACKAPILLVSGYFYQDDSMVQDSMRNGLISGFVTKPFRHEDLLQAIETVLELSRNDTTGL
jgi:DNA-binding response OmpR family regulator